MKIKKTILFDDTQIVKIEKLKKKYGLADFTAVIRKMVHDAK